MKGFRVNTTTLNILSILFSIVVFSVLFYWGERQGPPQPHRSITRVPTHVPTGIPPHSTATPFTLLPPPLATAEASTPTPAPHTPVPLTPSPTPTASATPGATITATLPAVITHTVQPGETLSAIALTYGTTVETIVEANHLENPDQLQIGQQLVIPIRKP